MKLWQQEILTHFWPKFSILEKIKCHLAIYCQQKKAASDHSYNMVCKDIN
jgi:hypothetical protein